MAILTNLETIKRRLNPTDDDPCDLTGATYKGCHPDGVRLDGRTIEVLGWDRLLDGYKDERWVLVRDSTGRTWGTRAKPVREEIARQTAAGII